MPEGVRGMVCEPEALMGRGITVLVCQHVAHSKGFEGVSEPPVRTLARAQMQV